MGRMYIVFVCHVETDWWDYEWASLELGFPVMIEFFKKVEKRTKQVVPVTYCQTPILETSECGQRTFEGFTCEPEPKDLVSIQPSCRLCSSAVYLPSIFSDSRRRF